MPKGITNSTIDFMFSRNPGLEKVPKLRKFYLKGHHFSFEKADVDNNCEWFELARSKGWLWSMMAHRKATYPTFTWTNFDEWMRFKLPEDKEEVKEIYKTLCKVEDR